MSDRKEFGGEGEREEGMRELGTIGDWYQRIWGGME